MYKNIPSFSFKSKYTACFVFLLYFLISFSVYSQDNVIKSSAVLAEKIYLQLDGTMYANDQDIWFKAIVVNAETHSTTQLSRVLYVELIGPEENILEKKLVKIDHGVGNNFFKLRKNYPRGRYLIRAYTEWNKNFETDFIFKTYVNVYSSSNGEFLDPIKKLRLIKDDEGKKRVNIDIDPLRIDSLQKKKINLYLKYNNVTDSLTVKKDNTDEYKFTHAVPDSLNLITLTLETENNIKFTKTVSLNDEQLDVQFFPESGDLLNNQINKIGFKVINQVGLGISIQGEILDQDNKIISVIKSNQFGMGVFALKPEIGKNYYARLIGSKGDVKYPLPIAINKGSKISILEVGEKVKISAYTNKTQSNPVYIQATCRGIAYYEVKGNLKKGWLTTNLPKNGFPEGIVVFTLLDKNKQPLAERLYFNELPENRLQIELSTATLNYDQRDKTSFDIKVSTKQTDSIKTDFSVLVVNKATLGNEQNGRQNILSYLLLDSELKGNIENPAYYFNSHNTSRKQDLDVLLLTQGWRKYKYNRPLENNFLFRNEPALNVSGRIGIPSSKIRKEGMDITMAVFDKSPNFYAQRTDSLGNFDFQIADVYGAKADILVQNNNKIGKKRNYPIVLSNSKAPEIVYNYVQAMKTKDSVVDMAITIREENKSTIDAFDRMHGVTQLEEVVVEDRILTPMQQKVAKKYGKADVLIKGEEIKAKEKEWSYGLYSVLLFNYPKEIEIETFPDGFMLAHVVAGDKKREATLVMINGELVKEFNYNLIPDIPPSEVKSVELIKYAKRFVETYVTVFPEVHPLDAPKLGHIISIYTHGNVGLHDLSKPRGQFHTSIPVFSISKEFYAPKYDTPELLNSNRPDLRSLVYWEPEVKTVGTKNATVEFYNGDNLGEMLIIVEGVSENGKIGYKELTYNVGEKD